MAIRTDVVRLYRQVHTWTGILTGLILFVCFYAGALTMFKEPLERWITPPVAVTPATLDRAEDLVAATRALRPEVRDFTLAVEPALAGEAPLRLTWTEERFDPAPWAATLAPDGSVAVEQLNPSGIGLLVDFLHRTVGIPGDLDIGTTVTGIASALYVVALVSGVIILLPSLVKDFLILRVTRNVKRMWLDAHNVLGLISLPFHLVIALSAVVFGLHDHIYDTLDRVVYGGQMRAVAAASSPFRTVSKDMGPAAMLPPREFLTRVHSLAPGFQPVSLEYHDAGTGAATVRVWGHDPRYLVRREGFVLMGAVDGRIIDTEYMPGHQNGWSATVSAFFALHFGSFGGGHRRHPGDLAARSRHAGSLGVGWADRSRSGGIGRRPGFHRHGPQRGAARPQRSAGQRLGRHGRAPEARDGHPAAGPPGGVIESTRKTTEPSHIPCGHRGYALTIQSRYCE